MDGPTPYEHTRGNKNCIMKTTNINLNSNCKRKRKPRRRKSKGELLKRNYNKALSMMNKIEDNERNGTPHPRDSICRYKCQKTIDDYLKYKEEREKLEAAGKQPVDEDEMMELEEENTLDEQDFEFVDESEEWLENQGKEGDSKGTQQQKEVDIRDEDYDLKLAEEFTQQQQENSKKHGTEPNLATNKTSKDQVNPDLTLQEKPEYENNTKGEKAKENTPKKQEITNKSSKFTQSIKEKEKPSQTKASSLKNQKTQEKPTKMVEGKQTDKTTEKSQENPAIYHAANSNKKKTTNNLQKTPTSTTQSSAANKPSLETKSKSFTIPKVYTRTERSTSELIKNRLCMVLAGVRPSGRLHPVLDEWPKIELKMSEILMKHLLDSKQEAIPRYKSEETYHGFLLIQCYNKFSKTFLRNCISKVQEYFENLQLRVLTMREFYAERNQPLQEPADRSCTNDRRLERQRREHEERDNKELEDKEKYSYINCINRLEHYSKLDQLTGHQRKKVFECLKKTRAYELRYNLKFTKYRPENPQQYITSEGFQLDVNYFEVDPKPKQQEGFQLDTDYHKESPRKHSRDEKLNEISFVRHRIEDKSLDDYGYKAKSLTAMKSGELGRNLFANEFSKRSQRGNMEGNDFCHNSNSNDFNTSARFAQDSVADLYKNNSRNYAGNSFSDDGRGNFQANIDSFYERQGNSNAGSLNASASRFLDFPQNSRDSFNDRRENYDNSNSFNLMKGNYESIMESSMPTFVEYPQVSSRNITTNNFYNSYDMNKNLNNNSLSFNEINKGNSFSERGGNSNNLKAAAYRFTDFPQNSRDCNYFNENKDIDDRNQNWILYPQVTTRNMTCNSSEFSQTSARNTQLNTGGNMPSNSSWNSQDIDHNLGFNASQFSQNSSRNMQLNTAGNMPSNSSWNSQDIDHNLGFNASQFSQNSSRNMQLNTAGNMPLNSSWNSQDIDRNLGFNASQFSQNFSRNMPPTNSWNFSNSESNNFPELSEKESLNMSSNTSWNFNKSNPEKFANSSFPISERYESSNFFDSQRNAASERNINDFNASTFPATNYGNSHLETENPKALLEKRILESLKELKGKQQSERFSLGNNETNSSSFNLKRKAEDQSLEDELVLDSSNIKKYRAEYFKAMDYLKTLRPGDSKNFTEEEKNYKRQCERTVKKFKNISFKLKEEAQSFPNNKRNREQAPPVSSNTFPSDTVDENTLSDDLVLDYITLKKYKAEYFKALDYLKTLRGKDLKNFTEEERNRKKECEKSVKKLRHIIKAKPKVVQRETDEPREYKSNSPKLSFLRNTSPSIQRSSTSRFSAATEQQSFWSATKETPPQRSSCYQDSSAITSLSPSSTFTNTNSSNPDLQIAIIDRNDPDFKIPPDSWQKLEKHLLESLLNEMQKTNNNRIGMFNGMSWHFGIKIVQCDNHDSLSFIKRFIRQYNFTKPGYGYDVISVKDLPKRTIVQVSIPPPVLNDKDVLKLLITQNSMLNSSDWTLVNSQERNAANGKDLFISISPSSLERLRRHKGEIKYGLNQIQIILPQHKEERSGRGQAHRH